MISGRLKLRRGSLALQHTNGDLDAGRMPHLGDHALCRVSILSVSKILICQIGGEQ
jgi:hypothetical protein